MIRARTVEELAPLLSACRSGRLLEVQEWIKQGNPVALPEGTDSRRAQKNPLRVAMTKGFHSLVEVLLGAGAPHQEGSYNALEHAVDLRRLDLVSLLVKHGASVHEVPMRWVFDSWEPDVVEFFISQGADLVKGRPVAWALIHKIRPALGVVKRYEKDIADLMRQAEFALRHHAYEGNTKWVSLLLWAGADPWAPGLDRLEELDETVDDETVDDEEEESYWSAVELAAMAGKLDVLKVRKLPVAPDPAFPERVQVLNHTGNSEVLGYLLEQGYSPTSLPDLGTAAISSQFNTMSWAFPDEKPRNINNARARECMKRIHMLLVHGAKWLPADRRTIADIRRVLLKMSQDYTLEFIWLMRKYKAAKRCDVKELIRTPSIIRLLGEDRAKAQGMVKEIPKEVEP